LEGKEGRARERRAVGWGQKKKDGAIEREGGEREKGAVGRAARVTAENGSEGRGETKEGKWG
jgi:hypothetical protein